MAYTVSDYMKDAAAAKQKREDAAWNRRHKKALRALMSPAQIHKELREKWEREERREERAKKRLEEEACRLTPARLVENFQLGGVAGVELREGAHPTAKVYPVRCRHDAKWKVSMFGRTMWAKQVQYILKQLLEK